ncbi:Chlorophyll(ide) b reductase NOL, chloroplastic, partial [Capsicum chinense]
LEMQDVKNIIVHNLSPGMVTTDLLMSGANTKQAKFFINILAEPADVVAEYLVPNIRSIPTNGSTKATYIRFLTGLKAYSQIFSVKGSRLVLEGIGMFLKIDGSNWMDRSKFISCLADHNLCMSMEALPFLTKTKPCPEARDPEFPQQFSPSQQQ